MSVHFVLLRCRPHLIYLHSLFPVTCFTPVVLLAILLFLVGCHNEASETQVEIIVPERERIPHYDREHIVVDQSRSFQELVDPPAELVLLHNYLQNPNELTRVPLDLMFSGFVGPGFGVQSLSPNRLLILSNSQLIEYDVSTHHHSTIAGEGQGPEDIYRASDITLKDEMVHIARGDMYVSSFDCREVPCKHIDAIYVNFRPQSAAVGETHYTLLELGDGSDPLRLVDRSGKQIAAFGDAYDSEEYPILTNYFSQFGQVQYSSSTDRHILSYSAFPYLYIYDSSLELLETYELADFSLPQFIFEPGERSVSSPQNDLDMVNSIRVVDNGSLLVEKLSVSHITETQDQNYRHEFYVLDLKHGDSFYIGGHDRPGQKLGVSTGEQVFVTDFGLVIYDHDEIVLYWIGIE